MMQASDQPVKSGTVDHIEIEAPTIHHAAVWPACDLCEEPLGKGGAVIGYPRPNRTAFAVHETCWQRCAERLGKLLEVYA